METGDNLGGEEVTTKFFSTRYTIFALILLHEFVLCPVLNKENSKKVIGKIGIFVESKMDIPRKNKILDLWIVTTSLPLSYRQFAQPPP